MNRELHGTQRELYDTVRRIGEATALDVCRVLCGCTPWDNRLVHKALQRLVKRGHLVKLRKRGDRSVFAVIDPLLRATLPPPEEANPGRPPRPGWRPESAG